MGRNRFVTPSVIRKELPDGSGDWIEIKAELTAVERRQLEGSPMRGYQEPDGQPEVRLDWGGYSMAKLYTWLVDWSFVDGEGRQRPCTRPAIDALDEETAEAINRIIDLHQEEIEREKKVRRLGQTASHEQSETGSTSS